MTAADHGMRIVEGGLDDPRVTELLSIHLTRARAETAPGSAHALDLSGLRSPSVRFWSVWDGETVLGCGALRRVSEALGEVKSMHTAERARRRGVGGLVLRTIMEAARAEGMQRLSLETGSWPYFEPARSFYRSHGFTDCAPFDVYVEDPNSVFMTMAFQGQGAPPDP